MEGGTKLPEIDVSNGLAHLVPSRDATRGQFFIENFGNSMIVDIMLHTVYINVRSAVLVYVADQ